MLNVHWLILSIVFLTVCFIVVCYMWPVNKWQYNYDWTIKRLRQYFSEYNFNIYCIISWSYLSMRNCSSRLIGMSYAALSDKHTFWQIKMLKNWKSHMFFNFLQYSFSRLSIIMFICIKLKNRIMRGYGKYYYHI